MTLTQKGSKATGDMVVNPKGITGYLKLSADEMKGELGGQNPADVVLKRQE